MGRGRGEGAGLVWREVLRECAWTRPISSGTLVHSPTGSLWVGRSGWGGMGLGRVPQQNELQWGGPAHTDSSVPRLFQYACSSL